MKTHRTSQSRLLVRPSSTACFQPRTICCSLLQPFATAALMAGLIACGGGDGATTPTAGSSSAMAESPIATPTGFESAVEQISVEALRADIAALADDAMAGRGPGTPGDELARRYLAERMAAMGLEPGGLDGGWEQPVEIIGVTAEVPATWTFARQGSGDSDRTVNLSEGDDFIAWSGAQTERVAIEDRELIFVGYGIEAPEYQWDDYKGTDLSGKVLVMLNNDPDWDAELFAGPTRLYYGRWTYKYEMAAARGAAGAILIHTTPSAGYGWQVVQTSWTGEQVELPSEGEPTNQVEAFITEASARKLFETAGLDFDDAMASARERSFEPMPLGITTSLTLRNSVSRRQTANVLGLLPGESDELGDQYVVFSAHHDHLGTGTDQESADAIYNGALDNAAGCAQVLEIARLLSTMPRQRSVLFAFVAAEESGLLGSQYFARHPTVPPGQIAANINYDGANIWGRTRDVTYIGYGKSSLDRIVEAGAALQGRTVFADQFPDRGFFYRSDQFNFAKIGVPAIYLDTGTDFVDRPEGWGREQIEAWERDHYHQVSDELEASWSFAGMAEDVALGLYCGAVIANQPELPAWNPGDEFEAARLEALAH